MILTTLGWIGTVLVGWFVLAVLVGLGMGKAIALSEWEEE